MGPVSRFTPVQFVFRLPPTLLLCAPIGTWPRTPRGVTLTVGPDGAVDVVCTDASELYGRSQVLTAAGDFLRANRKRFAAAQDPRRTHRAIMEAPDRLHDQRRRLGLDRAHRRSAGGVRQSAADSGASRARAREGCDGGVSRIEKITTRRDCQATGQISKTVPMALSLLALAERAIARAAKADAAAKAASLRRLITSVRELVPVNGPLTTRRSPTAAHLCEDVTGELMHDPPPQRSALAQHMARETRPAERTRISARP